MAYPDQCFEAFVSLLISTSVADDEHFRTFMVSVGVIASPRFVSEPDGLVDGESFLIVYVA